MLKVSNKDTERTWRCFLDFIVNFQQVLHRVVVFILLTLNNSLQVTELTQIVTLRDYWTVKLLIYPPLYLAVLHRENIANLFDCKQFTIKEKFLHINF